MLSLRSQVLRLMPFMLRWRHIAHGVQGRYSRKKELSIRDAVLRDVKHSDRSWGHSIYFCVHISVRHRSYMGDMLLGVITGKVIFDMDGL